MEVCVCSFVLCVMSSLIHSKLVEESTFSSLKGELVRIESPAAVSFHKIYSDTRDYFSPIMCVCVSNGISPVSCELLCCINMASKAREDKEVLCSPPTVPAFWESGFRTMGLKRSEGVNWQKVTVTATPSRCVWTGGEREIWTHTQERRCTLWIQ